MIRNSSDRYGVITRGFHWVMALGIIGMLIAGFYMEGLPLSPAKFDWYNWHKSVGSILIVLVVLRYGWRLNNPVPKLPDDMKWHEKLAAHGGHMGLYGLMLAMPLSGWLMSSAAGFPVSVFGWFTLPNLIAADKELTETFKEAHELLAFAIIGLASIHALAALYHHFIRKDYILRRMLPW